MQVILIGMAGGCAAALIVAARESRRAAELRRENERLRMEGKHLRAEATRRAEKEVWCMHCRNALTVTEERGERTVVTAVCCGLETPCDRFSCWTEPGQALRSQWRSK